MGAVGSGLVHLDAGGHEHPGRLDVAVSRGEEQWGEADLRLGVNVGPGRDELAHGIVVLFGGRPHQRRLSGFDRRRVDVGATRQQRLHNRDVAAERGGHQRGLAVGFRLLDVGTCGEQFFDDRDVGVFAGELERCHAVIVRRIDVGARLQQQGDHLRVVPVNGPEERGGAVGARRVDVDALFEQGASGLLVLILHRVEQTQVGTGCARCAAERQKPYERQTDLTAAAARTHHESSFKTAVFARPRKGSTRRAVWYESAGTWAAKRARNGPGATFSAL